MSRRNDAISAGVSPHRRNLCIAATPFLGFALNSAIADWYSVLLAFIASMPASVFSLTAFGFVFVVVVVVASGPSRDADPSEPDGDPPEPASLIPRVSSPSSAAASSRQSPATQSRSDSKSTPRHSSASRRRDCSSFTSSAVMDETCAFATEYSYVAPASPSRVASTFRGGAATLASASTKRSNRLVESRSQS